jgi:hypothetical protein
MPLKRLLCLCFGHPSFHIVHKCSRYSWKLICPRCHRCFGINFDVRICIPWEPNLAVCGEHS